MIKTEFLKDFIRYYYKAKTLQNKNLLLTTDDVEDPIMDNVTIYDTINRKYAGFSKVLEDIHGVRSRKDLVRLPDLTNVLSGHEFHFLHLLHRFTGSGASFQPTFLLDGSRNPKEHGYCNNIVGRIGEVMAMDSYEGVVGAIANIKTPMVTSVGNQPPSLKNPYPEKYRLAVQYYFCEIARKFIDAYLIFVQSNYNSGKKTGIKEAVDFCCQWHKTNNFKQWHFVLTAFVMDTAEYYPHLVDQSSHCYYGANCIRGFDLMFQKEKSDPKKKDEWYETCMSELVALTGGKPYDIEDVVCDVIRYWVEYLPKGYGYLLPEQRINNSTLKINGEYPEIIKNRITEVIG